MDNQHSRQNDLSLQGISIQPGTSSSRPTSARSNSQSRQPATPTRGGSAKDNGTNMSASMNFSSARQRRHSNSSQRSIGLTSPPPPPDIKKTTTASTSSSVFRVLSPPRHDVDGFFTERSQEKSDDGDWDETRRWVDELHQLNSSFIPQQQNRNVGPVGMSRDSLNGTITGNKFYQSNDNRYEQPLPISQSVRNEQIPSTEVDLQEENASIKIQRWYRKNNTKLKQKNFEQQPSFEQKIPTENEQIQIRITSPKEIQRQENNNSRLSSRRSSTASSTSKHRITPIPSPRPPTSHIDKKITPTNSIASSTSTVTSKVILDEVYETLRKLEEVEQFPTQSPLEDDAVYLIDPTIATAPSPFTDELSPPTSDRSDSKLSHQDQPNQYDLIVENVRSQKSTRRETPSPILTRFTTPPQSPRRQQFTKPVQSVSIPHSRASPSIDQQTRHSTKVTRPYKSLMVAVHPTTPREDEFKTRIDNKENQKQSNFIQHYELNTHYAKESEREFEQQLQTQKDEYESIIQRHLKFIDQLIEDKKKLSSRCELLVSELKTIDRKCNDRIRSIEESHRNEAQKLKDVHESAEKLRREHWIEEKTKKIKELTVRGLEPEIQKLINKHKNELTKIKTVHEAELLVADERASQRYVRMTEELRDQLEREKEVAIARERELAKEKYEKSLRDEEKSFTEQRRRLYTEIEEEKNRQAELATKQRADLDKLRRDIEANHRTVVDSTKHEYETTRLEQERRYANEINDLKEKLTIDKQNWEENYMKKQETILANKERELREQMKHERDREIERIIAQFESDTTSTKEEAERTADNRVKRIRDKYEVEFHELENSEKEAKQRLNQIKAQLIEIQDDRERLQFILTQKETEINDIKKITDTLQQERARLSEIIRQEFADRLVLTDDENRRVKNEIAELRARQHLESEKKKEEIETLQKQQEKELETIHEKIKQSITKKDEQVQGLRVQYETVVKKAENLENLLAQQRKLISARPSSGNSASKKAQPS